MADAFSGAFPALALRTDYIASDSPLQHFRQGHADALADNKRWLDRDIGAEAAKGNYLAAAQTSFRGGDLDTGLKFHQFKTNMENADAEKRLKALTTLKEFAQRADTPEMWEVYTNAIEKIYPGSVGEFKSFNRRPAALTLLEQSTLALQQSQAAENYAKVPYLQSQAQTAAAEAAIKARREQTAREMMEGIGFVAPSAVPAPAPSPAPSSPFSNFIPSSATPAIPPPPMRLGGPREEDTPAPARVLVRPSYVPPLGGSPFPPRGVAPVPASVPPAVVAQPSPAPLPTAARTAPPAALTGVPGVTVGPAAPVTEPPAAAQAAPPSRWAAVRQTVEQMPIEDQARVWSLLADDKKEEALKLVSEFASGPWKDAKQKADVEEGLRRELTTAAKEYSTIRDAYRAISAVAEKPSPAGDLSLIFSYMKMLDPGSTVREGEYATAQNATNVEGWLRNLYNRAITGQKLEAPQREDFVKQAKALYGAKEQQFKAMEGQFVGIAKRLKLDPQNVILDFSSAADKKPPPRTGGELPKFRAQNAAGQVIVSDDGSNWRPE